MRASSLCPILLLCSLSACAHMTPSACASSSADTQAVERTIRSYFAALATDNEAAAARLTSPNIYSFDIGKRFTGPELSATIKRLHQEGTVLQWNIGPIDMHFDCITAWAACENVGSVGAAGSLRPMKWLESTMLRRHRGEWVLEFLHSTRAQQTP